MACTQRLKMVPMQILLGIATVAVKKHAGTFYLLNETSGYVK